MTQDFRDPCFIHHREWQLFWEADLDRILLQQGRGILDSRTHNVFHPVRTKIELDLVGVELRHLDRFADQTVEAIALLVDDGQQLLLLLARELIPSRRLLTDALIEVSGVRNSCVTESGKAE